jgi:hypothetical protein
VCSLCSFNCIGGRESKADVASMGSYHRHDSCCSGAGPPEWTGTFRCRGILGFYPRKCPQPIWTAPLQPDTSPLWRRLAEHCAFFKGCDALIRPGCLFGALSAGTVRILLCKTVGNSLPGHNVSLDPRWWCRCRRQYPRCTEGYRHERHEDGVASRYDFAPVEGT